LAFFVAFGLLALAFGLWEERPEALVAGPGIWYIPGVGAGGRCDIGAGGRCDSLLVKLLVAFVLVGMWVVVFLLARQGVRLSFVRYSGYLLLSLVLSASCAKKDP